MPTFERTDSFRTDYKRLSAEEREKFKSALVGFVADLTKIEQSDQNDFRNGLRVKSMKNVDGILEMTWEIQDGRATFAYGPEQVKGKKHIIWRRIGGHGIFGNP